MVGSLFTVNGVTSVTSVTWIVFTQTFVATALGTSDLGATPAMGSSWFGGNTRTLRRVRLERVVVGYLHRWKGTQSWMADCGWDGRKG